MVTRIKAVAERQFDWPKTPAEQKPETDQIHLWLIDLKNIIGPNAESKFLNLLTKPEISRAEKIVNDTHRQLYLGGRAGLRMLLSSYSGLANSKLRFTYGDRGKPHLKNDVAGGVLKFNYTLSRGFALYGFALNRELGVDLEMFPRKINSDLLAKRVLSAAEQICWRRISESQHNESMLACWTRKEAYGKVLGVGIRYVMNKVAVFTDLGQDQWHTNVTGLFENEIEETISDVCGIQIGLPVLGVASLMYASTDGKTREGLSENNEPELRAFQL